MAANDQPVCQRSWVTAICAAGTLARSASTSAGPSPAEMTRPPEAIAIR